MRVTNIHKRKLPESIENVSAVFNTLTTDADKIWPFENWPAIRFKEGVAIGSKGGHGIVRYTIIAYIKGESITFEFTKPDGFIGTHTLHLEVVSENVTEIIHVINMNTSTLKASVLWVLIIRWLHDALIEEAFDKLENHFSKTKKTPQYNLWVQFLRNKYKKKPIQTKQV